MAAHIQSRAPSSWAEHRVRASLFWTALAAGPLLLAVVTLKHSWLVRLGLSGLGWLLLGWLLAVLAAGLYWQRFHCPRCAKTFYRQSPPLLPLRENATAAAAREELPRLPPAAQPLKRHAAASPAYAARNRRIASATGCGWSMCR